VIVIVNGVSLELTRAVAAALAERFDGGAVSDGLEPLPAVDHLMVPAILATPEPLARLRRRLFEVDDTTYVFRLVHRPGLLSTAERSLAASQERAADRADMGYPVAADGLGPQRLAASLWRNLHEPVELVAYDPEWPRRFLQEEAALRGALGELGLDVYHIGSTAVPELVAKPVIDIMASLRSLGDALRCIPRLRTLGYVFADYPQNLDRRFFRKGFPRTHHLHLVEQGSPSLADHLAFRDALRADLGLCRRYAALKLELAGVTATDRAAYGERKTAFIQAVTGRGS
jgi:GrpB-like predicted nucleotidyltransferase (UPF0157 family)